jgi:di/tricarboxylate transporter
MLTILLPRCLAVSPAVPNRCGISPKKLLMPMSHATVLGGTCTVIGTSTNLVISGLQEARYGTKNPENVFGFFTITPWGVPYAIWGEYQSFVEVAGPKVFPGLC